MPSARPARASTVAAPPRTMLEASGLSARSCRACCDGAAQHARRQGLGRWAVGGQPDRITSSSATRSRHDDGEVAAASRTASAAPLQRPCLWRASGVSAQDCPHLRQFPSFLRNPTRNSQVSFVIEIYGICFVCQCNKFPSQSRSIAPLFRAYCTSVSRAGNLSHARMPSHKLSNFSYVAGRVCRSLHSGHVMYVTCTSCFLQRCTYT